MISDSDNGNQDGADGRPADGQSASGRSWPDNVSILPQADHRQQMRITEALLFASAVPLSVEDIAWHLPDGTDVARLIDELRSFYTSRGVNLVAVAGKWAFRTADDLGFLLRHERLEEKRLSKAALETLAIIAYHQPVTRAEIEEIRGVSASRGTLDILLDMDWIRIKGRRRSPGRPVTYGTSEVFLDHFGLEDTSDLPGVGELKAAGLLDSVLPDTMSLGISDGQEPDEDDEEDEGGASDLFGGGAVAADEDEPSAIT